MASMKLTLIGAVFCVLALTAAADSETESLASLLRRFIDENKVAKKQTQILLCPEEVPNVPTTIDSQGIVSVDSRFLDTICEYAGHKVEDCTVPGELCCKRPKGKGLKSCQTGV